ncbi:TB2/DP1, HVA22 family-domain-containing protein, partial [Mrakia frigida]|uniref:HVA22/TB2/DP1 family protein n=1 Tax=Mrakia frigida TaxID=29902 RepID=UPI003FCC139C
QAQGVAQQVLNHPVVQGATDSVKGQVSALDKELGKHQFARDFEAKTHVPKAYTFLGLVATLFVTIFFNAFGMAPAVTNVLGYALPAYFSIQALESSGTTDDKQWLTYWISFSSFTLIESIFGKAIQKFIPWWFVLKTVLIVYLQLPGTRGAAQLYDNVLRPLLARGK